jgi:cob(I)alamin adenosyltransferase
MKIGLVQVYTGNGKGKTTAAIGQAIRACGHGLKVIMIQFMKGREYGELKLAKGMKNFTIEQYGRDAFVKKNNPTKEDLELAQNGLNRAREIIISNNYDIVVLDEINVAIDYGLIKLDAVLELIKNKPKGLELILTGRYAPPEIIQIADLVSEIKEVKHHYAKGVKGRKGIEY